MRALYEKIPIQPGESFCYRYFKLRRFDLPWHFHRECELTLIVKGRGVRYAGDSLEQFQEGDLVLLGPDLPHYWWSGGQGLGGAHSVVIQFDWDLLRAGLFALPEAEPIRRLIARAARGISFAGDAAERVAGRMIAMEKISGWRRLNQLNEILGMLAEPEARGRLLASAGYAPVLDARDSRRLSAVCKYVNDSDRDEIRQAHAASLAHLSPAAFSRYFHKQMGMTFEAYVVEVRVGHACQRLVERESSIAEIAFATGFNNLSNFNRHFRRLKGISPREYRRGLVP